MGKHETPSHVQHAAKNAGTKKKLLRILLVVFVVLLLIIAGAVSAYFMWEEAPEINSVTPEPSPEPTPEPSPEATPEPTPEPMDVGIAPDTERQDGVYTILLVGVDEVSNSTDTMMIARFDTVRHEADIVSFPRDTLINNEWDVRKLNSVYWGTEGSGGDGIWALKYNINRLIGFEPDCYALIDLKVLEDVINAMGGVYFDVPFLIEYEDWMGNRLDDWKNIEPGYQRLDGFQSVAVCRHRQSYVTGDLGRIEMQQSFLKAMAKQFITAGNIPNAKKVVNILSEGLKTDLSAANIAFFLRQALQCGLKDIQFYTMPTESRVLQGYSYAVPRFGAWLTAINQYLNPYEQRIYKSNLDVVYIDDDGKFHATIAFNGGRWYYEE